MWAYILFSSLLLIAFTWNTFSYFRHKRLYQNQLEELRAENQAAVTYLFQYGEWPTAEELKEFMNK